MRIYVWWNGIQANVWILCAISAMSWNLLASPAAHASSVAIVDAEPTVFFRWAKDSNSQDILAQQATVTFAVPLEQDATLSVELNGNRIDTAVPVGSTSTLVNIPDTSAPGEVTISAAGENVFGPTNWLPQRKWRLWIMPSTHIDLYSTSSAAYTPEEHARALESALSLTESDPTYRYQIENTIALEEFLELRPERAGAIMEKIASGQIGLGAQHTGLHQAEAAAESLVQSQFAFPKTHSLLEHDYPGVKPNAALVYDVSSVALQTPQLLQSAGVPYLLIAPNHSYSLYEGTSLPYLFRWRAPDGSDVLTWRASWNYGYEKNQYWNIAGYAGHSPATEERVDQMLRDREEGLYRNPYGDAFPRKPYPYDEYLIIWDFGDNNQATAEPAEFRDAWNARWTYPQVALATASGFLDRMKAKPGVPVVTGEFPDNWAWIVMGQSLVNQFTRAAERTVLGAETWWGILEALGLASAPRDRFRSVESDIAKVEAHDFGYGGVPFDQALGVTPPVTVPGVISGENTVPTLLVVDLDKASWARRAETEASALRAEALGSLEARLGATEPTVAVFNSSGQDRSDLVFVPADEGPAAASDLCIVDLATSKAVVHQQVEGSVYRLLGEERPVSIPLALEDLQRAKGVDQQIAAAGSNAFSAVEEAKRLGTASRYIAFVAKDVPAVGYRLYALRRSSSCDSQPLGVLTTEPLRLESPRYIVGFDAATGAVTSIWDKDLGAEIVDREAPYKLGELLLGAPSTDFADIFDTPQPAKTLLQGISGATLPVMTGGFPGAAAPIARGPVFASMLTVGPFGDAPRLATVTVYRDLARVDLVTITEFKKPAAQVRYMVALPFAGNAHEVRYEVAFGVHRVGRDDARVSDANRPQTWPRAHRQLADWIEVGGVSGWSQSLVTIAMVSRDAGVFTIGRPDLDLMHEDGWEPEKPWVFPVILDTSAYSPAAFGVYVNRFSFSSALGGAELAETGRYELIPVALPARASNSPTTASFLRVEGATLSVVKPRENGEPGLALRFYNPTDSAREVEITWGPLLGLTRIAASDLNENEPSSWGLATCDDEACSTSVTAGPWEVKTVLLGASL